jgi:choline dehydrogenase-like flavoprotein
MLIDGNTRATGRVVETDICVIGAGPAGITFAREFAGTAASVVVLESGHFKYDQNVQDLAAGELDNYYWDSNAISDGRQKQFGGTTNMWVYNTVPDDGRRYARCVPPEEIDFAACADQPDQCWPMPLRELDPFFQRAQIVWNGGKFNYDVSTWSGTDAQAVPSGNVVETRISQHGPCDVFGLHYRDDLLLAPNIDVYLGCTALALESDGATGLAKSLRVARPDGQPFSVAAKIYILAGGGVENVQMLLLSDATRPGAVGNRHDNVGRYVTTHPDFRMGTVSPDNRALFDELALYDLRWKDRYMVAGFFTIAEEVKKSEQLLNMSVALVPRGDGFGTSAHRAMTSLSSAIRRRERATGGAGDLRTILRSPKDAAAALSHRKTRHWEEWRGGWSRPEVDRNEFTSIELWASPEQTPERENKYTLADTSDRLGRNRIKFDWQWSKSDRENIERSVEIFGSQLEANGFGSFRRWLDFEGPARPMQLGLHHPMGGTRMHVDPRLGVVDENCLVHGSANTYVAGSSVFPTGLGYANPTLTLLALTVRLADRVKAEMGVSGA